MAAPIIIEAPHRGERMVFLKTAAETNGDYLEFDHYFKPGCGYSPEHVHIDQDEVYEVVSGAATYQIAGVEKTASAGETIRIQRGTYHVNPWNKTGTKELYLHRRTTPEGEAQLFFTTWFALDRAGGWGLLKPTMEMNTFQISVMQMYLPTKSYVGGIPIWMQQIGIPVFAWVGRLMGYKERYPELE